MATTETSGQRLERLKSIVPGLTNDVIGEWFGLTAQAVQKWTKAEVPRNRFATIVEKTGVAEEWLVLGKGEPFPRDDEDALPAATGAQMQLAENVRILRERAGMTQAELAEKLGKGQTTIFKIENGQTLRPRFMDELAQALGVSRIQLEFGTPDAEPLTLTDTSAGGIIKAFLQESNITIPGGVKPVPREQYSLPL